MMSRWWLVCLLLTSVIHENKGDLKHKIACQEELMIMTCTGVEEVISSITSANYGRTLNSSNICTKNSGNLRNDFLCNSIQPTTKNIVEQTCLGKKSCRLFASNTIFGDPSVCRDPMPKFLSVEYSCTVVPCIIIPKAFGGGTEANPKKYKRFRSITLEGKISTDCVHVQKTTFSWICQRDGQHEVNLTSLASRTSPILAIPSKFFSFGSFKFLFKVSVITISDVRKAPDVPLWIEIVPSDLQAEIAGGGGRVFGWSTTFVLDASGSMDPDTESREGLVFAWKCAELTSKNFEGDFTSDCPIPLASSVKATVPGESLRAGKTYIFCLDMSKGGRATVHSFQRITILPGVPLQMLVTCLHNCESRLNPLSRLVLAATCLTCDRLEGYDYEWSMIPGHGSIIKDLNWDRDTLTGRGKRNLVVKAGIFSGEQPEVYFFKCSATHKESQASGFGLHTVTINTAPTPGTCSISPKSGFALQTKFNISCAGFSDPDGPLSYEFRFRSVKTGTSTSDQMIYSGKDSSVERQYLPLGNPQKSYALEMVVMVKDVFGAGVESTLTVIVKKAPTSPILQNLAKEIDSLLLTGNSQTATQIATVIGSALNAESVEDSDQNVYDKAKIDARKELRETLITSLAPVNVYSIDGVKQTTSALSIVTNYNSELSAASKANAATTLMKLSSFLSSKAAGSIADEVKDSSRLLVNGLSNIIEAAVATDVNNETSPANREENKQQNRNALLSSVTALKDIKRALSTNKVVGEIPTLIKTDTLLMVLDKRDRKDILGGTFGITGGSSVRMPASLPIEDSALPIVIEIVEFHVNPFNWAENSGEIKSLVTMVTMTRGGEEIRIENLAEPISIYLPQSPGLSNPVLLNISTTMMSYIEFEVLHKQTEMFVNLTLFSTNSNKEVNPVEAGLQVYVRYGEKPNPFQYDFKLSNYKRYGIEYVAHIPASFLLQLGTYHLGVLLRNETSTTDFNLMLSYSMTQCRYWETAMETWWGEGGMIGPNSIPSLTHCLCTHLTSFGGTWVGMPNKLNLAEDISKFLTFWENPLTIALVVVLTIIYFLMLVWAWRKDKRDQALAGVFELSDNNPIARHAYLLTIFNGSRRQAGTTSTVAVTLIGTEGKSEPHLLEHANYRMCQTGAVDTILLRTEEDLGDLKSIRLWHDNSGTSPDWFVSHVTVEKLEVDKTWCFLCYSWLSVNIGDGILDKVFPVATQDDLKQFNHLFTTSMSRGLKDTHLYFSIFMRPSMSNFTRVQRLSCCFTLLLCMLLTNIMFYGVEVNPEGQGVPDLDLGAFVFNWLSFIISIESAVLVLPINILLAEMFRRSRPRHPKRYCLAEPEVDTRLLDTIKAQVADHKKRLYNYFKGVVKSDEHEPEVFLNDLNEIVGDELELDEQKGVTGSSCYSVQGSGSEDFMLIDGESETNLEPSRRQILQKSPKDQNENTNAWPKGAHLYTNTSTKQSTSDRQQREARFMSSDRQPTEAQFTSSEHEIEKEAQLYTSTSTKQSTSDRQQGEARFMSSDRQPTEAQFTSSEHEIENFHDLSEQLSDCRQVLSNYLLAEPVYQRKDKEVFLKGPSGHFAKQDQDEEKIARTTKNPIKPMMKEVKVEIIALEFGGSEPAYQRKDKEVLLKDPSEHFAKQDQDEEKIARTTMDAMKPMMKEDEVEAIALEFGGSNDDGSPAQKKKCCEWDGMLPWWFVYIAWILLFLVAGTAAFFTMLYGLNYGKEKSWNWLITVFETMFVEILFLQPLKILGLALFFAVVLKRGCGEVLVRARQLKDWKPLSSTGLLHHRQRLQEMRYSDPKYKPPAAADVLKARQHHHQQKRMMAILKEIVGYITYLWVVLLIAHAQRDPQAFYLGDFVGKNVFDSSFTNIKDFSSAWEWMNTTMVNSLYPSTRPGFLMGESLFIVGQPQLRQVRAESSVCSSYADIAIGLCRRDAVDMYTEDTMSYNLSWSSPVNGSVDVSKLSRLQTAYSYQTGEALHSLPSLGEMFSFSGGGYAVRLGSSSKDAQDILSDLYNQLWLDKNTNAILLEFTVYSANTNLFCVVTGVLEFPDAGSVVASSTRQPIRLYRYTTSVHIVVLACEIFYCAFMIGFIVVATLNIVREKWKYFHCYWNWLQVTIILVSLATIAVYIVRSVETTNLIQQYKNDRTQFVSFAHAALLDSVLGYLIAILVALGTLKFLHLLRFNPQIFYFLRILNMALATIKYHLLALLLIMIAYSGFGVMMFGRHVHQYSSLAQALLNLFNLAFCGFDYYSLANINVHAARFFLFTFVAVSNYIIFNVMISALLYLYNAVMAEGTPNEDTELLLLMLQRIGEFLGLKCFKAKDEEKTKK